MSHTRFAMQLNKLSSISMCTMLLHVVRSCQHLKASSSVLRDGVYKLGRLLARMTVPLRPGASPIITAQLF